MYYLDNINRVVFNEFYIESFLQMVELNNRKIAKNAIMLSLRMAVVAIVGLYTSRIVLEALGVADYGLYGLVGGIVGMVSFLNGAMGGATTRFITYEIGAGNKKNLKEIFSTSVIIHLCIAGVAIIIAETVGLWILHTKLVIPEEKMFAANIIFQLSMISLAIGFTQVPYTAMIIAHERMNIYAYFEIINVILKLVIVYILLLVDSDRLIYYAFMMFLVSMFSALFYRWYCIRYFDETRVCFKINKLYARKMLTFSGYDLYGNMSVMVYLQGLPIVINVFLGVVANAASSIGTTVTGVVKGFAWSVSSAFTPQITKQYAAGNIANMENVMCRSIMFTALTFAMCAMPFFVETQRVLFLWLGQIPDYAVAFLRAIMIVTIIDYLTMSNNRGIHATGNIKHLSLISGSFYLICPFISYITMELGGPAYTPYAINATMLTVIVFVGFYLLKKQIQIYNIWHYISIIARTYGVVIVSGISLSVISHYIIGNRFPVLETSFWTSVYVLILIAIINIATISGLSYLFVLNKEERLVLKNKLKCVYLKILNIKHL